MLKFFVLLLLDGSFLYQDELKLTLMVLLGVSSLATCEGIFRGNMREFIGVFSAFLEVQTAMVAEFCGFILVMEEAQKMRLTNV